MPGYTVDDRQFREVLSARAIPDWLLKTVEGKIEEIRESPKGSGGRYREKWGYPLGKYLILALIDDENKTVKLMDLIHLP